MTSPVAPTTTAPVRTDRRAGLLLVAGGILTAVSGLVVQLYVRPNSDVPDDRWSYPLTSEALLPVSVLYAAFHGLVLFGILGLARSGAAGSGRAARVGGLLGAGGTAVLLVAELLSPLFADDATADPGPMAVGALFGLGTVVSAIGFLVLGVATLRARRWTGWRRFSPLKLGIATAVLLVIIPTPLMAAGIALYGLTLVQTGAALATAPVRADPPVSA